MIAARARKRPQRARKTKRASDVVNGCKLIAVMWILIPINQGQCGLRCHSPGGGRREAGRHTNTKQHTCCCTLFLGCMGILDVQERFSKDVF